MIDKMFSENDTPLNNQEKLSYIQTPPWISVVVPVHNEDDNIISLINEIQTALDGLFLYEIIYVDDGSSDNSWPMLQELALSFNTLRMVRHRRAYGQSVAILTGVKVARAEWIATLDGDGQNDPADIIRLLAVLKNPARPPNLQMVAGYRRKRQDRWWKRVSSTLANAIRRRLLHDDTPDTGCGIKVFSRQAFLELPHFNHCHRFLPALILRGGGQVISVEVNHRPRLHGQSKYGIFDRLWVGLADLLGVMWLQHRPVVAEIIEETGKHE
jgi:dolichol-phosphate mannosyltransferase